MRSNRGLRRIVRRTLRAVRTIQSSICTGRPGRFKEEVLPGHSRPGFIVERTPKIYMRTPSPTERAFSFALSFRFTRLP
jgi:hypothetical protein